MIYPETDDCLKIACACYLITNVIIRRAAISKLKISIILSIQIARLLYGAVAKTCVKSPHSGVATRGFFIPVGITTKHVLLYTHNVHIGFT